MSQLLFLAFSAIAGIIGTRVLNPITQWDRRTTGHSIIPYAITLASLFLAHIKLIEYAAMTQTPFPAWLRGSPLVPILETAPFYDHTPPGITIAIEFICIAESVILAVMFFVMGRRRASRSEWIVVVLSFASMATIAIFERSSASADLLAYVWFAKNGLSCYSSSQIPPHDPLRIIGRFWGNPPIPCAYGPVWIIVVHAVSGWITSLSASIIAIRIISTCTLVATWVALVRLKISDRIILIIVLDPTIVLQYINDGHNDLFGVSLLLWARVYAKDKNHVVSIILAALSGASKLTMIPLIALTFVDDLRTQVRIKFSIASITLATVLSLILGGVPYIHAIITTAATFPTSGEPGGILVPRIAMFATLIAILITLIQRRISWATPWAFASLANTLFPWYLIWGLPYAVLNGEYAWIFLASIPIVAFCLSTTYSNTVFIYPILIAMPICGVLMCYSTWRWSKHDEKIKNQTSTVE